MHRFLDHDDLAVLGALLDADAPLSVHALSHAAAVSIARATNAIARLADAGCRFDSHPQHGHRLLATGIECWSDYIETKHPSRFGRRTLVYRCTASTQDAARQLIAGVANPSDFDGHIVVADHQTAGRGRLGRTWQSRPGEQLLVTAIVADAPHPPDRLMLAAAVAVGQCVESILDRPVDLHWPNDVYVNGAKLAGILIETTSPSCVASAPASLSGRGRLTCVSRQPGEGGTDAPGQQAITGNAGSPHPGPLPEGEGGRRGAALLGIGINVAGSPDHYAAEYPTASVHKLGRPIDRLAVLDQLCQALTLAMQQDDEALAAYWRMRSGLRQQRVTVHSDGRQLTGRVLDIDPSHGLLFEIERGPVVTLPAASTSIDAATGVS